MFPRYQTWANFQKCFDDICESIYTVINKAATFVAGAMNNIKSAASMLVQMIGPVLLVKIHTIKRIGIILELVGCKPSGHWSFRELDRIETFLAALFWFWRVWGRSSTMPARVVPQRHFPLQMLNTFLWSRWSFLLELTPSSIESNWVQITCLRNFLHR